MAIRLIQDNKIDLQYSLLENGEYYIVQSHGFSIYTLCINSSTSDKLNNIAKLYLKNNTFYYGNAVVELIELVKSAAPKARSGCFLEYMYNKFLTYENSMQTIPLDFVLYVINYIYPQQDIAKQKKIEFLNDLEKWNSPIKVDLPTLKQLLANDIIDGCANAKQFLHILPLEEDEVLMGDLRPLCEHYNIDFEYMNDSIDKTIIHITEDNAKFKAAADYGNAHLNALGGTNNV